MLGALRHIAALGWRAGLVHDGVGLGALLHLGYAPLATDLSDSADQDSAPRQAPYSSLVSIPFVAIIPEDAHTKLARLGQAQVSGAWRR